MEASLLYCIIAVLLTTGICFVVLTVYVVKLLISATKLTDNANVIATSIQKEVEPTLKELQEAAKSINSIVNKSGEQVQNAKNTLATFVGTTASLGGKLKNFTQGVLKGISFGLGLFKK